MRHLKALAIILCSVTLLASCSSSVKLDDKAQVEDKSDSRTVSTVDAGTVDPLNDPKGVLLKRSVYFDFDSYIVKDEYKPLVNAHSGYLNKNKGRKIVIQGNTDERGGREYNLALGQKRAEAVSRALGLLGVPNAQMEAVSFGKEKPAMTGHSEDAYAQNRRVELSYR